MLVILRLFAVFNGLIRRWTREHLLIRLSLLCEQNDQKFTSCNFFYKKYKFNL